MLQAGLITLKAPAYLRATPLPHLTAIISFTVSLALVILAVRAWSGRLEPVIILKFFLAVGFLNAMWIALADAYNRYREYQRLRALLARHGFRPMILRAGSKSRCQRDAALAAAHETGHRAQAERFFKELGYRWYHLLPDGIAGDPLFLFRPRFLKATLLPRKRRAREHRDKP